MAYPHTGSITQTPDGRNTTRTSVSTNIIIQVDGNPIGAMQSFSINQSRIIHMVDEIGTDGHIDSVPSKATDISGTATRLKFDNLCLPAAFSRGYVHLASQRIPFDINIIDIFAASEDDNGNFGTDGIITTVIKNVWFISLGVTYTQNDFTITEQAGWQAERIYSFMGSPNNGVVPAVNARQLRIIDNDPFERQTDVGGRRGALDAAGLINAVSNLVG